MTMIGSETLSSLAEIPPGYRARVRLIQHPRPEIARRLRELGICEEAVIRCILRGNGNMICEVRNMRIGLDNTLARSILVSLINEASAA